MQFSPFSKVSWIATDWSMVLETTVTLRDDFCASRTKMPAGLPGVPFISLSRQSGAHKRGGRRLCSPAHSDIIPFLDPDVSPRRPAAATHSSESFGEPTVTSRVGVPPPQIDPHLVWLIQKDYFPKIEYELANFPDSSRII